MLKTYTTAGLWWLWLISAMTMTAWTKIILILITLRASRSAVCISSSVANAAAYTKLLTADHRHRHHNILRHLIFKVLSPDIPKKFSDNIPPLVISNLYAQSAFVECARGGIEWSYRSLQIGCKTDSFCPFLPFLYTLEISSISLFHSIFRPSFHIHLELCFLEKVSKHRS